MKHITFLFVFFLFQLSLVAQSNTINKTQENKTGFRVATNRKIDIVIIHSTYYIGKDSFGIEGVLKQFRSYKVMSHYIIDRKGDIYYMVDEKNVAYHAGNSQLPGSTRTNLNTNSIGIEIINTPSTPPNEAQYKALANLVASIKSRYKIEYVLGHNHIAPGRKTDPWLFNWEVFNEQLKAAELKN